MTGKHFCALFVIVVLVTSMIRAEGPAFKTFAARDATAEYDAAIREITRDAQAKTAAAQKTYAAKLEKAKAQATQAGDLDDAVRIKDTITQLKAENAAEPGAASTPRLLADRAKLTRDLAGTIWSSGGTTYKFNADGTGVDSNAKKTETWQWVAVDSHSVYLKVKADWTDCLTFDEKLKTFTFQEYGNGTRRDELAGKRVQP